MTVKQPSIKQLLKMLMNKTKLMTAKEETTLWEYYNLLKIDGFPLQKHVDAWESFTLKERAGITPQEVTSKEIDELKQIGNDNAAFFAEWIDKVEDRLQVLEKHLSINQDGKKNK